MTTFSPILKQYNITHLLALQSIAITTFDESYAADCDADDMDSYMKEAFSLVQMEKELLHPHSLFYGIWIDDEVVAYMKINLDSMPPQLAGETGLQIQRIYILKAFQRQNLGTILLEKAYEIAKEYQRDWIWLVVWDQNPKAMAFYQKKGFEMNGTMPFAFGGGVQYDCCMVKKITL